MKLNSVVRSDLSISSMYILFRSIMFFPTKSCWKTTLFSSILVQSWAMLHIPRYISSSRLRLSNFVIPFERPYAGEVFYIKVPRQSLCVSRRAPQKCPKFDFFETLSERLSRGLVWRNTKAGNKLCNLTKTALFICFWICFYFLTNMYIVFIALLVRQVW